MVVSVAILENFFRQFSKFILKVDGRPFRSFRKSNLVYETENYKYSVYNEARKKLEVEKWNKVDIGTRRIHEKVDSAINTRIRHSGEMVDNNLIDWRKKDDFSKIIKSKSLERILFNFYKSKISDKQAFENLITENLSYQIIAYLFFIKNRNRYLPISQARFDEIFKQIELSDFKTSYNRSWDNYTTFLDIIKQTRNFLLTKDHSTSLLDAHSFLWILGNQMKNKSFIVEADEELSFPEGKDKFRLHKSKERNRVLIRMAKEKYLRIEPTLRCQVCKFSFEKRYGELGKGFIEAHHLIPISQLKKQTKTRIKDLALVCSNCHRMLHRERPWLTLERLKSLMKS